MESSRSLKKVGERCLAIAAHGLQGLRSRHPSWKNPNATSWLNESHFNAPLGSRTSRTQLIAHLHYDEVSETNQFHRGTSMLSQTLYGKRNTELPDLIHHQVDCLKKLKNCPILFGFVHLECTNRLFLRCANSSLGKRGTSRKKAIIVGRL